MAVVFALAFILVPIAEIALFIEVGGEIGLWNTIAVVVLTAIVGTWMLRTQGMLTLRRAQESLARQEFPVSEVFDGLCLLVGGVLLLTPGFLTDAVGFLLFLPPLRKVIRRMVWRYLSASATFWVDEEMARGAPAPRRRVGDDGDGGGGGAPTIDGEYHEVPPDPRHDNGDKP